MKHEQDTGSPSEAERIKESSRNLRGSIVESLRDPLTGAVASSDNVLLKFHGTYQQDDRDLRRERQRQRLEPLYQFMVRVRMPGGVCTPAQLVQLADLADRHANGTLRVTTRQTFQFHGILKRDLRASIRRINDTLLDTIAACGDVNRNVLCNPNPHLSSLHGEVYGWARHLSEHLLPRTRAYHEIWLGDELVAGGEPPADEEPLYGRHYLPRKFKIAIAVPPSNDVDVFTNDLGFIAIVEDGRLAGFDVAAGGGMGATHGDPTTYPRLGNVVGFCRPDELTAVAEAVLTLQRDFGDRSNRKHARLKYTIDKRGLPWFVEELTRRLGRPLAAARPFRFATSGDRLGWTEGDGGRLHQTLHVLSGRIADDDRGQLLTALRDIAGFHRGDFRLTTNQNIMLANVDPATRPRIDAILRDRGVLPTSRPTALRLHALSCVALPTCGQAMAEGERALPGLLARLEPLLRELGLGDEPLGLRVTGCPNGCARPYVAEIGLVGKSPGRYNLHLGGDLTGERLNVLHRQGLTEDEILATLEPHLRGWASHRLPGEPFGDYLRRTNAVAG